MPTQTWTQLLSFPAPVVNGTALANTATLTDVSPAPQLVIPANLLAVGTALRVTADGVFSTAATAPTLLLGVYYGGVAGTALATTGAITTAANIANQTWRLVAEIVVRSAGATGSALTVGEVTNIAATAGVSSMMPATAPAAVTINTTADYTLTIGAQWGTASASNTLTVYNFLVELLD